MEWKRQKLNVENKQFGLFCLHICSAKMSIKIGVDSLSAKDCWCLSWWPDSPEHSDPQHPLLPGAWRGRRLSAAQKPSRHTELSLMTCVGNSSWHFSLHSLLPSTTNYYRIEWEGRGSTDLMRCHCMIFTLSRWQFGRFPVSWSGGILPFVIKWSLWSLVWSDREWMLSEDKVRVITWSGLEIAGIFWCTRSPTLSFQMVKWWAGGQIAGQLKINKQLLHC